MLPKKMIDMHTHPSCEAADVPMILDFMDANHVEKIVSLGSSSKPERVKNILALRKLAPDRVIGAPHIDPRSPKAFDELARACDAGCRMVKLFPNLGYYPDDPQFLPFFKMVAESGCGILSHCGWLGGGGITATKYAKPGRFEKLFRRFPDTLFIMAHMGGIDGFIEGIMYTTRTPNVYLDTTPGQSYWVFEHAAQFVRGMPPERLLLGTDGIVVSKEKGFSCEDKYEIIANHIAALGWAEHLDDIFYNNAARVIEEYKLLP